MCAHALITMSNSKKKKKIVLAGNPQIKSFLLPLFSISIENGYVHHAGVSTLVT